MVILQIETGSGSEQRRLDRIKRSKLQEKILGEIPDTAESADQRCREVDLAIDFCEDVPELPLSEVDEIVRVCESVGAPTKISSIHINGWFGDFNRQKMSARLRGEVVKTDRDREKEYIIFAGETP
jgi:hypothetical protein